MTRGSFRLLQRAIAAVTARCTTYSSARLLSVTCGSTPPVLCHNAPTMWPALTAG